MTTMRFTLIAAATIATTVGLTACSTSTTDSGQSPTAASTPATTTVTVQATPATTEPSPSSTPTAAPATDCVVNPADRPVPTVEIYDAVSDADQLDVSISGIPSGTVTPGAPPVEVEVKLCNASPVAYPSVGVVVVLEKLQLRPRGNSDREGHHRLLRPGHR